MDRVAYIWGTVALFVVGAIGILVLNEFTDFGMPARVLTSTGCGVAAAIITSAVVSGVRSRVARRE